MALRHTTYSQAKAGVGPGLMMGEPTETLSNLLPGVMLTFAAGTVATANVEVLANGGLASAAATWVPMDPSLTNVSANTLFTQQGAARGIRLNVTNYTSGTVYLDIIEP